MKLIGFSNSNHLTKILVEEKLGFYLSYTSFKDRILILNDNMLSPRYVTASNHLVDKGRLDQSGDNG